MFRFLELSLHGWAMWSAVRIPLDRNVILVSGPNGSGKTTLLDALRQLLNAPRLSSRRRLQQYLRRPDMPALIRAVVSNGAAGGGPRPFRGENLRDDEVTLACALVPSGGGTPEKRFAILAGRVAAPDLQRFFLESRDWLAPDRYARALEKAGVTRSLMTILAIEQGKLNSISEQKPRELFSHVLEMLGDKAVLERYNQARRRYEDTRLEVHHQMAGLSSLQVQLAQVQRRVGERETWEDQRAKVDELEARLPAAELQKILRAREEIGSKLAEFRTKVRNGDADIIGLGERLAAAVREEEARKELLRDRTAQRAKAEKEWETAKEASIAAASEVRRLEGLEKEAAALPEGNLDALAATLETARDREFERRRGVEDEAGRGKAIRERLGALEAGRPAYPESVVRTLEALPGAKLLADLVLYVGPGVEAATEAALGDARFALLVPPDRLQDALRVARELEFPGPVYGGETATGSTEAGPLRLSPGAPSWLSSWMAGVTLEKDGTWGDVRGRWVAPAGERVLGKAARELEIENARRQARESEVLLADARKAMESAGEARRTAEASHQKELRRRALLAEIGALPARRDEAGALAARGDEARTTMGRARREYDTAFKAEQEAARERARLAGELTDLQRRLEGERDALRKAEEDVQSCDSRIRTLDPRVTEQLRERARAGELDSPETVGQDLARAKAGLVALGEPPPPEVREEHRQLAANVREAEEHVTARQREADEAGAELSECRKRYLDVVDAALQDYRKRAIELGKRADVKVEMELPRLENRDQALDEAGIQASFGFDGKEPLPLGDASFSGGQQVISGILLIMAMADTDGQGFFMLDEPFAHLSLDRVDDVGRFLRSARAQFLLTAPTTLDRAQLDPASMVIVLQKKKPDESYAPDPIVGLS